MNRNKYILIFLMFGFGLCATAQDFILGVRYGLGKAAYKRQSDDLMISAQYTHRVGMSMEFSPFFSKFFVVSGIEYEINDFGSSLSIPLGIRIALGNTLRPFVEAGGYYSHPLNSKHINYTITRDLGARIGAGLMFYINKRWRLEIGYFHQFGFKGVLDEEIELPLGQVSSEKYDLRAGHLALGVKYRF